MAQMLRLLLGPLLAAACSTRAADPPTSPPPTTTPIAASPTSPPTSAQSECIADHTARDADGEHRCYPYLCRAGACLTRCVDHNDCAGARTPAQLATRDWPLECMPSGACTPMSPDELH